MLDVVFIHGTGVRQPAFDALLRSVRTGLQTVLPKVEIHPCYWGSTCGSRIVEGRSIPLYNQSKGNADDAEFGLWSLLYEDPLVELRLLHAQAALMDVPLLQIGKDPVAEIRADLDSAQEAVEQGRLRPPVAQTGEWLIAAIEAVRASDLIDAAVYAGLEIANADLDMIRDLLARAIIAGWIARLVSAQWPIPNSTARDALFSACTQALNGRDAANRKGLAVFSALLAPLRMLARPSARLALHSATWGSRAYRHTLFDLVSPKVGDILLYQARGEAMRGHIAQTVAAVGRPVVLLAHSLGGIACIDWLIEAAPAAVKGIITAGSQAPFFYEINALSQLERGKALPEQLPPWLNFYDRNDLLSFIASGVMPGDAQIEDVELRSGQPFPASHSAYWDNAELWQQAGPFIERCLP